MNATFETLNEEINWCWNLSVTRVSPQFYFRWFFRSIPTSRTRSTTFPWSVKRTLLRSGRPRWSRASRSRPHLRLSTLHAWIPEISQARTRTIWISLSSHSERKMNSLTTTTTTTKPITINPIWAGLDHYNSTFKCFDCIRDVGFKRSPIFFQKLPKLKFLLHKLQCLVYFW